MIGQPGAVALVKRAPHPFAGLLFYDFVLNEGQAILRDRQIVVTNRNYESPIDRTLVTVVPPELLIDQASRWQRLFDSVFLARH
jgi:iron(III) transport system substrate-binding protein